MSGTSAENLNRIGSVATEALDQTTSFPVKVLKGVGLDIVNNDTSTDLKFSIAGKDGSGSFEKSYKVPAGTTLNELFKPFTSIDIIQATTSFDIIVREPM